MTERRSKVVLYNPRAVYFTMPLAVLAVASALDRRHFEPVLVGGRFEADPVARLVAECRGAAALGVSVLTGAPISDALAVTRAVKRALPDLEVVWGGWHLSLFPSECLDLEPAVDAVVVGQGERTFAELLGRRRDGDPLDGLAGAAWRGDGRVVLGPPRPMLDLSRFPPHDYGLLPVERYFHAKGRRQLDYVTSQGCRFRCSFATATASRWRSWSSRGCGRGLRCRSRRGLSRSQCLHFTASRQP